MNTTLRTRKFVIVIFVVIIFNTCFNIATFPEYFWDEGVYVDRALHFLKTFQMYEDPNYVDHPPLGWIIPSIIFALISFPSSITHFPSQNIESQVLSLFLIPRLIGASYVVLIAILVYKLSNRFYNNRNFAAISLAVFALIPAMWPFRNFLLDPLMILFVLLSLFILIPRNSNTNNLSQSHHRLILSGTVFGCALLVKLSAIFFLPAVLLFAIQYGKGIFDRQLTTQHYQSSKIAENVTKKQRARFAIMWLVPIIVLFGSWVFIISAQGNINHLIHTQLWETARTSALPYGIALQILVVISPVGLIFGVTGLAKLLKNRRSIITAFLSIPYIGFLFRGGFVGFVQVIPILPILSIYAGKPVYQFSQRLFRLEPPQDLAYDKLINPLLLVLLLSSIAVTIWIASFDATKAQREAIEYLTNTLPKNSVLVTNPAYSWVIKQYRPDIQVTDYFNMNFMEKIPDEIYIAESTAPAQRDLSLTQSQHIYEKSCIMKAFKNDPPAFHSYSLSGDKPWNVTIRYFNTKGC